VKEDCIIKLNIKSKQAYDTLAFMVQKNATQCCKARVSRKIVWEVCFKWTFPLRLLHVIEKC